MMEMKIKIEAPQLAAAVEKLANALTNTALRAAPTVVPEAAPAAQMPAVAPAVPVATPVPVAPVAPAPAAPAPVAPVPAVPVTAPTYTLDQLAVAGGRLVDAGKMEQLLGLLTKYGAQAITQLNPDQYGAFAVDLRALGAQI